MIPVVEIKLPARCTVFGDFAPIRHDDTILSLTPEPHLAWICPNCGDVQRWALNTLRYDYLALCGYDFAAAINGEPIPVREKAVRP